MTAIKHLIQQEIFEQSNERVLSICHVGKFLKKKKTSFLCLISGSNPPTISIVQVKQTDKVYKRKRSWTFSELKTIDGKTEDGASADFDLHFDKVYRWVASNIHERQNFIVMLYRQSVKYLKDIPVFKNIPKIWLSEDVFTPESITFSPLLDNELSEDFQAITEKEQEDLSKLMVGCEFAISNAEAFMEVLSRDLSLLDGENVQCVLASEEQVETLMKQLELAISEAENIEAKLDNYDEILCNVRDTMEKMEKKNSMISTANKNNLLLLNELENIINQLNLPRNYQMALEDADLTSAQGLKLAIEAGSSLQKSLNAKINPALMSMVAVQEQLKQFEKFRDKFSRTIARQLNNLFIHYGNHKGECDKSYDGLVLPQHNSVHKELNMYTELMHWMKAMDQKAYNQLRRVYTDSIGKLYERDLKTLFEAARDIILGPTVPGNITKNTVLIGMERDQWSSDVNSKDRFRYDQTLEQVLSLLEPVCLEEQQFCVSFFQLDVVDSGLSKTPDSAEANKKMEKQINESVRNIMSSIFSNLEEELVSLISNIEKHDAFYCMYGLVRLNQHVMSAQSTFLSNTFASVLIQVKRCLDKFMQTQIDSVKECKLQKKSKCGILPYVLNFEDFAHNADVLLRSDRRPDLEKWYSRLLDTMLDSIALHAVENGRTPAQVIKMENYHQLSSLLAQLKISVLDSQRREAKLKYTESLEAYVTLYFGRPLEKLNTFFDGVQTRVASGVKASEVSYQMAFSKQELRKVIGLYPGHVVKKGLESLYRKVEKHLSEDSNLLQVVWHAMQEEFITQYKNLEDLIQQCYPGSMITLEFTIDDILNFFSDIARSH